MVRCVKKAVILGVLLLGTPAFAGQYCYTRGKNTYCDNGDAWHQTPSGGIVPWGKNTNKDPSYHRYGNHLYGSDGSWRAKKGNNKTTDYLKNKPTYKDRVIDEIFSDDNED